MSYHHTDDDSAEAVYRDRVRRRLLRTHAGLSLTGCIGIIIAFILAFMLIEIPATPHADGGYHQDAISPHSVDAAAPW